MYKKRFPTAMAGLLALAVLTVVCLGATILKACRPIEQAQAPVLEPDLYRNQGLEQEVTLSGTPVYTSEDTVIFTDRVLLRCSWDEDILRQYSKALQDFLSQVQNLDIRTYSMVMPLRIGFEEPFSQDAQYLELVGMEYEKMNRLEEELLSDLEGLCVPIPVMQTLKNHEQEYLFYRTDAAWTALGAYYAAREFLNSADMETFPIEDFWEYAQSGSTGILPIKYMADLEIMPSDRQYYYLLEDYNPQINQVDGVGEIRHSPMVSRSGACSGLFLGSGYDYCTFDGLSGNGRSLLIVGSPSSNAFASWMVSRFERISYLQLPYFNPEKFDFESLMKDLDVTDLLVIVDAAQINEDTVHKLNGLTGM